MTTVSADWVACAASSKLSAPWREQTGQTPARAPFGIGAPHLGHVWVAVIGGSIALYSGMRKAQGKVARGLCFLLSISPQRLPEALVIGIGDEDGLAQVAAIHDVVNPA